jgi:tRNA U34 5-methylaminomethyl-2-thiouridine-forming methyltransferase MnmC
MSEIPDIRALALEWIDGDMPYSQEFGDHFYCREDGRAECGHVFLAGNSLPERWAAGGAFVIGELGFGTGLNFCETWRVLKEKIPPQSVPTRGRDSLAAPSSAANEAGNAESGQASEATSAQKPLPLMGRGWRARNPTLHFVSFELHPMRRESIDKALGRWPELDAERRALVERWPDEPAGAVELDFGNVRLSVVCGDAFSNLADSPLAFDAWYLDGFAPSRNPAMWSEEILKTVFDHTRPGGTFATYAAAGFVRRNLVAAGFSVERRPGFAGKREMLCGARPGRSAQ